MSSTFLAATELTRRLQKFLEGDRWTQEQIDAAAARRAAQSLPPPRTVHVNHPTQYQSYMPHSHVSPPEIPPLPEGVTAALDLLETGARLELGMTCWNLFDKRCGTLGAPPSKGFRVSTVLVATDADFDTWMAAIRAITTSSSSEEIPAEHMKEIK